MINPLIETQHRQAFLITHNLYGMTLELESDLYPPCFKVIKGKHDRGIRSDEEFIQGLASETMDSTHSFWVSAWRKLFPKELLDDNNQVIFSQGEYLKSSDDNKSYFVEHIVDDTGSPYLRFRIKEV